MIIKKILNNNTVMSTDGDGSDIIVKGKGIAFKQKSGNIINDALVERVFKLEGEEEQHRYFTLINQTPADCIQVSEEIIDMIKRRIKVPIRDTIYISLTDHISNLLERLRSGMHFDAGVLWDVKRLYPEEYIAGKHAVGVMNQAFNVHIDADEANFIALHIVNAELTNDFSQLAKVTQMIEDIYDIVESEFELQIDPESLTYTRFIMHLRIFFQRLYTGNIVPTSTEQTLITILKHNYPDQYACTIRIFRYIEKQFQRDFDGEVLYILVHIIKLTNEEPLSERGDSEN